MYKSPGSQRNVMLAGLLTSALLVPSTALAYLDPGTGSMLVQGLIAGIAMVWLTVRTYWDKLLRLFGRVPADEFEDDASQ